MSAMAKKQTSGFKRARQRGTTSGGSGITTRRVIRRLSTGKAKRQATDRLAELREQVRVVEDRLRELRELSDTDAPPFDPDEIAALFADFDAVWSQLIPREQAELVGLLVARIEYDGVSSAVAVSFHETGINSLNGKRGEA